MKGRLTVSLQRAKLRLHEPDLSPPASRLGLVVSITELPWQQNGDHVVPDRLLLLCVGDGGADRTAECQTRMVLSFTYYSEQQGPLNTCSFAVINSHTIRVVQWSGSAITTTDSSGHSTPEGVFSGLKRNTS